MKFHEVHAIAPLRTRLIDAAEAQERVGERSAFGDGHRAGLLAVDVFARLGGRDRKESVPAIAGRDEQGVNVLARPQLILIAY